MAGLTGQEASGPPLTLGDCFQIWPNDDFEEGKAVRLRVVDGRVDLTVEGTERDE